MLTQQFMQLIAASTGLKLRSQPSVTLWQKLQARMQALQFTTPEQYYHYLSDRIQVGHAVQSHPEWQALIQLLMTGESYFLRDRGQFRLLQQQLLPTLIQARRQQAAIQHTKPLLRLWSAGCSTGEEAYSLAMLVQQLLPDWRNWDLLILGTDINAEAIAHAKEGIYHSWSFRIMSPAERSMYFRAKQGRWKLDRTIRSMVTFDVGNLVQDPFPSVQTALCEMDLIVCRNVFIYFEPETVAAIVAKFSQTLRPGGYLMTGHTELYGQRLEALSIQSFPESVVYHRSPTLTAVTDGVSYSDMETSTGCRVVGMVKANDNGCRTPTSLSSQRSQQAHVVDQPFSPLALMAALEKSADDPSLEADSPAKQRSSTAAASDRQAWGDLEERFQQGDYAGAIVLALAAIAQTPQSFALHSFIAQSYISLEAYEPAKEHARKMANIDALSTAPYYLLAYIARQQEEWKQAKALLKRIIYLDATAISAYLELGDLYTQEGNAARAKKMQTTAMALMQQLDREEGRGKREEGRGKREEGRGKREEGRGKREGGLAF